VWWTNQNLDSVRKDNSGGRWNIRVWHDHVEGIYIQRVFFWNDGKTETGVVELAGGSTLHVSRLKQLIGRLVAQPDYRRRFRTQLEFPVEREYANYAPLG
jgi:hypothetical protein